MNGTNKRAATLLQLAEAMPAKAIVQTVNGLLAILRKRGVAIVDFEDRDREVHGFKIFTSTAYCMATKKTPEGKEHGLHEHE